MDWPDGSVLRSLGDTAGNYCAFWTWQEGFKRHLPCPLCGAREHLLITRYVLLHEGFFVGVDMIYL